MVFVTIEEKLSHMFDFEFVPQTFVSILVMVIVLILAAIIGFKAKHAKVDDKPRGLLLLGIMFFRMMENLVYSIMSKKQRGYHVLVCAIAPYIFLGFIISLTGLPSPILYIATPLSLALIDLVLVHKTAIEENKWGYFKRYIDPIPIFLPINIITTFTPTLSLTLRMFGNAISGYCIMSLVYYALEGVSDIVCGGVFGAMVSYKSMFFAPIVTPILHLYFDLFSGFIQTMIFCMLALINVAQEQSEEEEVIAEVLNSNT